MRSVIKNIIKSRRNNTDDLTDKLFIDSLMANDQIDEEEVAILCIENWINITQVQVFVLVIIIPWSSRNPLLFEGRLLN